MILKKTIGYFEHLEKVILGSDSTIVLKKVALLTQTVVLNNLQCGLMVSLATIVQIKLAFICLQVEAGIQPTANKTSVSCVRRVTKN